jgi:hypothetical protein
MALPPLHNGLDLVKDAARFDRGRAESASNLLQCHMSANGTKRTYRGKLAHVRFEGQPSPSDDK